MPRPTKISRAEGYLSLRDDAARVAIGETNDCTVVAIAAATGLPYLTCHNAMAKRGRKDKSGSSIIETLNAISDLGFVCERVDAYAIIDGYPAPHRDVLVSVTTHHPDRFPNHWPKGTFLMFTRGHALCIKDGVNMDHTRGTAKRAIAIFRVKPA